MHRRNKQFILLISIHIRSQTIMGVALRSNLSSKPIRTSRSNCRSHHSTTSNQNQSIKHKIQREYQFYPKAALIELIIITSIGVDIFFSLILSYFCFLVPAFSPCQGRLKKKLYNGNI